MILLFKILTCSFLFLISINVLKTQFSTAQKILKLQKCEVIFSFTRNVVLKLFERAVSIKNPLAIIITLIGLKSKMVAGDARS